MQKKIYVLLVQGGPSSEHDISLETGRMVFFALNKEKYTCEVATIQRNGKWVFSNSKNYSAAAALTEIERQNFDVAFIALHGAFGEDGGIQTLFEMIGLPYIGSGPEASALAMNKAVSSALFKESGMAVAPSLHIGQLDQEASLKNRSFPVIVKPCHGGSSIQISIAKNRTEAWRATKKILATGDSAIVQKLIQGREFTCGILENERGTPQALPPTEIIPVKAKFFDYKAKYAVGGSQEITPPNAPRELIKKIQDTALQAHHVLGCSGMSRSDFILENKSLYILETNTLPGLTATSLLPQEALASGIPLPKLLDRIIKSALRKKHLL